MSPDAEGPQPGESAAQDDEDLPEVNISPSLSLFSMAECETHTQAYLV